LAVLGELQARADGVRGLDPLGRRCAEHVEDELSDRIRRQVAVADEVVERLVAGDSLILAVCLDEAEKRLSRQRALANRRPQPPHERVPRRPLVGAVEVGLELVEERLGARRVPRLLLEAPVAFLPLVARLLQPDRHRARC
jgi:hypothetical protein